MKYLDKLTNILIILAAIGIMVCTIVWLTEPQKTVYQIHLNDEETEILFETLDEIASMNVQE